MAKPSLPISKEEKAGAYLNVLSEINARLRLIKTMKLSTLPYGIVRELCHLQLRHICELVAIGCLVVQGYYTSFADFTDEYNPSKVFRALNKKYEGFFPQPTTISKENGCFHIAANTKPNAMTRVEMEKLWSMTGNYLHRLKLKHFFRAEDAIDANFWPSIDNYVFKLETLLNPHVIPMHRPKTLVVAGLEDDTRKPYLAFLEYLENNTMHVHQFNVQGATPFWHGS